MQLHLFAKPDLLNSFSFSVYRINMNILEYIFVYFHKHYSTHNFHASELKYTYSFQSFRNLLMR